MNTRIFVEKKIGFRVESESLKKEINQNLKMNIKSLRLLNVYDVLNISEELLEITTKSVLSEVVTDNTYKEINLEDKKYISIEYLPGTFVQRESSAMECISLLDTDSDVTIKYSQLIIVEDISNDDLERIKQYHINEIEMREKDLSVLSTSEELEILDVPFYEGFIELTKDELKIFKDDLGLAMSYEDIEHIQNYFKNEEKRNPSETEILMLDTYWSDHCRHTTFETVLTNVMFEEGTFKQTLQKTFNEYLELRTKVHNNKKPMTLMDMATISGKYQKKQGNLDDLEISEEVNACSVVINVDVNGKDEEYLLMFKNETHNHPTEIEPFGGASTCVGGAIRDPLSGRSYVYQAMRISGSANPLENVDNTLEGKLSQRAISLGSAKGYSSYGNQIGLTTGYVKEMYHEGYKAKHMEVGVVVAAAPKENVIRESAEYGDVVIMLGGKTGRDGVGGATGSSKVHTEESLETASAEVQKGNAPEERKIQRLFRRNEVSTLIKKSNDFGAGGVSVAIGEIAESVHVHLDNVKVKYAGLNGTEIAISESQERMAVVIKKEDTDKFIKYCEEENIEAVKVADVTNNNRLVMEYRGQKIVDLNRDFINTNGVRQSQDVLVKDIEKTNVFKREVEGQNLKDKIFNNLKDINVSSQKGMIENFDATVGASTVLMPFGGKHQLTKTQAAVQKVPVLNGETDTASILSYGYNPFVSSWSPFHGAAYAVVESMARIVAVGGSIDKVRFTFQEYFERLNKENDKWGKPFASLLGSMYVLNAFNLAAIGGKDSMSGTFKDINVPPTLISFAVTTEKAEKVISQEFKEENNNIYVVKHNRNKELLPNTNELKENFEFIYELAQKGLIKSSSSVLYGGISQSLFEMSFGNKIGFEINTELDLFESDYGTIIIETKEELTFNNAILIGKTSNKTIINDVEIDLEEALNNYQGTFKDLNPINVTEKETLIPKIKPLVTRDIKSSNLKSVHVLLPVFPGMNSEYDMDKAFSREGANTKQLVFRNMTKKDITNSIKEFVEAMKNTQILAISGGFSAGDEPDGSGKFIATVLSNKEVKKSIEEHLNKGGLILGICNGFQALIKSGILPTGKFTEMSEDNPTLFRNDINRHISHITKTVVTTNNSPWLTSFNKGEVHSVAVSHGEGKFVVSDKIAKQLFENNQVAFQYSNNEGTPSMSGEFNPNGSSYAIEGILSPCGQILGKMGHSERYGENVYKNIDGNKNQNIFRNAIKHFKEN